MKPATWDWFALNGDEHRPLFAFPGVWTRYRGPLKKEGENVDGTGKATVEPLSMGRDPAWETMRTALRAVAENNGARVIDPLDTLCTGACARARRPMVARSTRTYRILRASYVRDHATFIDQTLGVTTGSIR